MKTITKLSASLLAAILCMAWTAVAQPSPSPTPPPTTNAPAKPRPTGFRGTVSSVDTATMTLSLKARGGNPDTKVKVTHDTKIKKDKEPAQFTDVVEGMRVSGSGKKGEDGVWTANTLNIMTKPPTRKAPPAADAPTTPPQ